MTDYLTVIDVLAIHTDQIERYGSSHGIRGLGSEVQSILPLNLESRFEHSRPGDSVNCCFRPKIVNMHGIQNYNKGNFE